MNVPTPPATTDASESASDRLLATLLHNNGLLLLDRGLPQEALRAFLAMSRYPQYRSIALLQAARAVHKAGDSTRASEYVEQAQNEGANPLDVAAVAAEVRTPPAATDASATISLERKRPVGVVHGWVDACCSRLEAVVSETCQDIRRGLT